MIKLEICVDRRESAIAAFSAGADRIEVCGALGLGGITPSHALIEQCVSISDGRVMAMIRPHAGGFCYSDEDTRMMIQEIHVAKSLGVQGVVFGALRSDGSVDNETCKRLIDAARPLSITFHRAFDLTPSPLSALDSLLDLGIDRLLTSGQAAGALQGADLICDLVRRSGKRLTVMAGSGIQPRHIQSLLQSTGVHEIHASASTIDATVIPELPGILSESRITRHEIVQAMVDEIRNYESL